MRSNRLSYAPEVSEIIAQVNGFGKILLFFTVPVTIRVD